MIGTLRRLFDLIEPGMRWRVAGLFAMMMAGGILEMGGIGLFLPFMVIVFDPARLSTLPLPMDLVTWLSNVEPQRRVAGFGAGLLLLYLVKNLTLALLTLASLRFTFRSEAALQRRLLAAYLALPYAVVLRRNSSEFVRTIMYSARGAFNGVLTATLSLLLEGILVLAALSSLVLILPLGGLSAAALGVVLVVGLYLPLRHLFGQDGARIQKHYAHMYRWISQALGSVKELKVLGRESYFLARFAHETNALARAFTRLQFVTQLPRYITELVVLGVFCLALVVLTRQSGGIVEALPLLGVFGAAALRLLPSANRIIQHLNTIRQGERAVALVHEDLTVLSNRGTSAPATMGSPMHFGNGVRLEGVSLRHDEAERNSLEAIDLEIEAGEAIALVGSSGAGKTTLADVILGLLQPSAGRLTIDGVDIRTNMRGWQDRLGYVPQTIYLLDDTVRRNVAFGIPDGEIDDRALNRAITMARLDSVVGDLPLGLETVLGENGVRLSGGQRQRIGIARALYHNPDLLIFDEATSALDTETEREVVAAIDSLRGARTVILIAHRLSTVRHCDRVALLEGGRLIDCGPFETMTRRCAAFRRMVEMYREEPVGSANR